MSSVNINKPSLGTAFRNHINIRIATAISGMVVVIWFINLIFKFLTLGLHAANISYLFAAILGFCVIYFAVITNLTIYIFKNENLLIKLPLRKAKIVKISEIKKIEEIGKVFPHLELHFKEQKKVQKYWIQNNEDFIEILLDKKGKNEKITFSDDEKKIMFS